MEIGRFEVVTDYVKVEAEVNDRISSIIANDNEDDKTA